MPGTSTRALQPPSASLQGQNSVGPYPTTPCMAVEAIAKDYPSCWCPAPLFWPATSCWCHSGGLRFSFTSCSKEECRAGGLNTNKLPPKCPVLGEGAQTYRMKRKLMASNAGKMIRSRTGILCMMETAEEREMGGTDSKREVPLLKALEIILMLILPSSRDRQGYCDLHYS